MQNKFCSSCRAKVIERKWYIHKRLQTGPRIRKNNWLYVRPINSVTPANKLHITPTRDPPLPPCRQCCLFSFFIRALCSWCSCLLVNALNFSCSHIATQLLCNTRCINFLSVFLKKTGRWNGGKSHCWASPNKVISSLTCYRSIFY